MKKLKPKVEEDPRGVRLDRLKSEPQGMDIMSRNYQPYEGAPYSTIPDLASALCRKFDQLVLHDTRDECLIVLIAEDKEPEVSPLPCRIHHPTKI